MRFIRRHVARNERSNIRRPILMINKFRQDANHRTTNRNFVASMARQLDNAKAVRIDQVTMEAIRVEVSNLMYAGLGSRSCKVTEIATALKQSKDVVDLYVSADDDKKKDDDVETLSSKISRLMGSYTNGFGARFEDDHLVKRKYQILGLLDYLEKRPESIRRKVSTWEEARDALSVVFVFPDDGVSAAARAGNEDRAQKHSIDNFKFRVKSGFRQQIQGRESQFGPLWKKIVYQKLPPKISNDEEIQTGQGSVIDELDAKLSATLSAKYDDLEERQQSADVQAVEQRLLEKEAEDRASSLMRKLTLEEQEIVNEAIYGDGPSNEVIAQIGSDSIQRRSLHLLQPGQWLNDEVIHYFLVMLAKRDEELCSQDSKRKPTHFFKSFFLTKLLNDGDADRSKQGVYEYRNVKRWSKHVKGKDIFKLSKIFFPINQSQTHWFCAMAFMEEKRIQCYDSMGSSGRYYLENIFRYIQDEHMDKKGTPLPDIDQWKLVPCTSDTPSQYNGYDCGVFTCMFADFLSKDCPLVFNQQHIAQCRERIALSIMSGSAIM